MIDIQKFNQALVAYKKQFDAWWWTDKNQNEKYKWQAVKHFQDNWDVNAEDFGQMFRVATAKHYNLLDVQNNFPLGMIIEFAKIDNKAARAMFSALYDEYESLQSRIATFKSTAEEFRKQHNPGTWNMHYQDEHAISVYLWFRYPEKYYIYKYKEFANVAKFLNADIVIKKGKGIDNVVAGFRLYDEICALLKKDEELMAMFKANLDETTYKDEQLKTLTSDFGYYISRVMCELKTPEKTVDLQDVNLCWYVGAMMESGDQTERFIAEGIWEKDFSEKRADTVNSINVGDKIAIKSSFTQKNNLPFDTQGKLASVMRIKAYGTVTENPHDGKSLKVKWEKTFDESKLWYFFTQRKTIWRIERKADDWMYGALLDFTFNDAPQDYVRFLDHPYWAEMYGLTEVVDETSEYPEAYKKYIALLEANHNIILSGAPGTGKTFLAKEIAKAMGAKVGFVQFHPSYDYTDFVEGMRPTPNGTFERRDGVFKKFCRKAFNEFLVANAPTSVFNSIIEKVDAFMLDSLDNTIVYEHYNGDEYKIIGYEHDLNNETQIFIFNLKTEAVTIIECSDLYRIIIENDNINNYTIDSSVDEYYSYIVELAKKIENYDSEEIEYGKEHPLNTIQSKINNQSPFIFIIDEINRGEISKIFGELFFSIDPGYRGKKGLVQTQYQDLITDKKDPFFEGFYVPENVYIIGTMNDIDRSVEPMDFAMRRRFTWVEVTAEESAENMNLPEELAVQMRRLNKAIAGMEGLNKSYQLGGAYFLDNEKPMTSDERWQYRIEPLLKEYLRGMDLDGTKMETLKKAYFKPVAEE